MTDTLSRHAVIGILGGGQLGRMLSVAASRLGFRSHIFDPNPDAPATHVADAVTTASFSNETALTTFANSVDVITFEFENIPISALDVLGSYCAIKPDKEALRISQDRLIEKTFLQSLDLQTVEFVEVCDLLSLRNALDQIGTPAILKTRQFGYDGKGQICIVKEAEASHAFKSIDEAPAILEKFVEFDLEISVIAARGINGSVAAFDPGQNEHHDGILRKTIVPARVNVRQKTDAILISAKILNALDYVGVIGVEFFVTENGLLVNEIAPRVHNSGHWTQNACAVDQFEQHIRAISGWPLSDGRRHVDVVMENLIGHDIDQIPKIFEENNSAIHLYGKLEVKPGRKMGHVNRLIQVK
ncbi:MAG: 5-(carboxyamino)imidazole ribonucleotide synthase [Aestuariivita sp.]|nr:5-(carboxyamino)imidazole ribonucleotide synthase [Aestuariivita sp.]